jgi:protein phosphatase
VRFSVKSDLGLVRTINEDSYFIRANEDNLPNVFIIADGMGGHNAGEIASATAAKYSGELFISKNSELANVENILDTIVDVMNHTNTKVFNMSKEKKENSGMGTTLITVVLIDRKLYIGHIGDSRLYKVSDNNIIRITTDHSLVEELVKSGSLTREEAERHPKRNIITRALGCADSIEVDTYIEEVKEDDIILMCTDGLNNMVLEDEIKKIILENDELDDVSSKLIEAANFYGGEDNATVILFKIDRFNN